MSPFLQTRGGGSAQGFKGSGGGGPDGLTQANAAETVWKLITEGGQTSNGYYWLKGNGAVGNARQFYCILDPNWMETSNTPIGAEYGWAIVANHDAAKHGNAGHQARPTAQTGYAGSDGGDVNVTSNQIPNYSYTQHLELMPFKILMHICYNNSSMGSWNSSNGTGTPYAYYYFGWNSVQTIPTSNAWSKQSDWNSGSYYLKMNGSNHQRRLAYGSSDYDAEGVGCFNNNSGPAPYLNGSSGPVTYPVYAASYNYQSSGAAATFSWHDTSNTGWDDWQDGSGMGDGWAIEGVGNNAYRNQPSFLCIH